MLKKRTQKFTAGKGEKGKQNAGGFLAIKINIYTQLNYNYHRVRKSKNFIQTIPSKHDYIVVMIKYFKHCQPLKK